MAKKIIYVLFLLTLAGVMLYFKSQGYYYTDLNPGDYVLTEDVERYWRVCKVIEGENQEHVVNVLMFPDRLETRPERIDPAEFALENYVDDTEFLPLSVTLRGGRYSRTRNFIFLTNTPVTPHERILFKGHWPLPKRADAPKDFRYDPSQPIWAPLQPNPHR
ncbi:hypothetical protein QQ056_17070 [Oscillatoria laete-virens NRMC-F 0139]|nr:hypothetical protein [Oscillatoria laete-virens]MDL5055245.1 hypothetical protein [Oscillatoria laete-virens NRMC-F 0139]